MSSTVSSPLGRSSPTHFHDRDQFLSAAGTRANVEDWRSYPPGMLLQGQQIRGVTYKSSSAGTLVVGAPHGGTWRLGYPRDVGHYASFSDEVLSFEFESPIEAFGIALSQGNRNQGTGYSGSTTWRVTADEGRYEFHAVANYTASEVDGEVYFGVIELDAVTRVEVVRARSDAPIVWNVREIGWRDHASRAAPDDPS